MQGERFVCEGCRHSMLTKIAVSSVVPSSAIKGGSAGMQYSKVREILSQPWCTLFGEPMPLNPNTPVIECEGFERLEAGEKKSLGIAVETPIPGA